jgi:thiamine biosynthesis protein ThiS
MIVRMGKQCWEFSERMQVRELLRRLNVLPNMVVVVRNGETVTEDEWLEPTDEVEVIRVISGGKNRADTGTCIPGHPGTQLCSSAWWDIGVTE